jgi:AcrR family transcriptional regulator
MESRETSSLARKRRKETSPRDAAASRARILEAARVRFSQNSYEGVGVREIAADAGVDPALVVRYFGSKEGLFREIAAAAFDTDDVLAESAEALPEQTAEALMGKLDSDNWRKGYDPVRFLFASIGSPTAGPILAEYLDRDFVAPISEALDGDDRDERGAMIAAQILGFALVRAALASRPDKGLKHEVLKRLLTKALAGLASDHFHDEDQGRRRDA